MIAIIDYGAGNLRSVELAFKRLNADVTVTGNAETIMTSQAVVLPGVGAFADAMNAIAKSGLTGIIKDFAASGRPFLGICLGMQALFDKSEEGGDICGLGIIPGTVRRIPDSGLKIPHIGWNNLEAKKKSPFLAGLPESPYAYFVHSYACHANNAEDVLTVTEYGIPFHSAVQRGNITGVQFHPEKSGHIGSIMLENFIKSVREAT